MYQIAVLSLLFAAAPVPKDEKPVYYAATKVGDRREYRDADGRNIQTIVVLKVEKAKEGGLLVTEGRSSLTSPLKPQLVLLVNEEEVAVKEVPKFPALGPEPFAVRTAYSPPNVFVKPKAKRGDRWEWNLQVPTDKPRPPQLPKPTHRYTAAGFEKVTVPAGTFEAVKVEGEEVGTRTTSWYAPGVGLVKRVTALRDGDTICVLHAFTPGD